MILIAENSLEDQVLPGLVNLLRDLRVDASGFHRADAVAPIFWSAEDFSLELASLKWLSKEEMTDVLKKLEPDLMEAMILSGFNVIETYLENANGIQVHKHHRKSEAGQGRGRKQRNGGCTKRSR